MPDGSSDPPASLAPTDFSQMPIEELSQHHRDLTCAQRAVQHWHRLISARIDLAVASVADLDEPPTPSVEATCGALFSPPAGLRALLGIPRSGDRIGEVRLLGDLRQALAELDVYGRALDTVTREAADTLGQRVGTVRLTA